MTATRANLTVRQTFMCLPVAVSTNTTTQTKSNDTEEKTCEELCSGEKKIFCVHLEGQFKREERTENNRGFKKKLGKN